MSVTNDPSGRRCLTISVDLEAAPPVVWEAVASEAGLSAWFLPSEIFLGFDGEPARLTLHLGPHTSRSVELKEWVTGHRFQAVYEEPAPQAPPLTVSVELQRQGRGSRLSLLHTLDTTTDEWDALLTQAAEGWAGFLRILALYLNYFAGRRSASCTVQIATTLHAEKAWELLAEPLGLYLAAPGQWCRSEVDAPVLAGLLEGEAANSAGAILRTDEPAPGLAYLRVANMHGFRVPTVRLYLYGEQAPAVIRRQEPQWQAWLSDLFG